MANQKLAVVATRRIYQQMGNTKEANLFYTVSFMNYEIKPNSMEFEPAYS